jgi:competence protein ComEA
MTSIEPRSISRASPTVPRTRDDDDGDRGASGGGGGSENGGSENGDTGETDGSRSPGWLIDDVRESALTPYLPERWRGARLGPGRSSVFALCAVGVVVLLLAGFFVLRDSPQALPVPALPVVRPLPSQPGESSDPSVTGVPSPGSELPGSELGGSELGGSELPGAGSELASGTSAPTTIVVSVVGLVTTSGLVHLPAGSRVADALAAAGGARSGADVLALNLAARIEDGSQIVVGAVPPEGRPVVSGTVADSGGAGTSVGPAPVAGEPRGKLDLNKATAAELDALPGVGPVTAASIVSWRETSGPFTDVGQLSEVNGIGPVRLEKLRDQVTV